MNKFKEFEGQEMYISRVYLEADEDEYPGMVPRCITSVTILEVGRNYLTFNYTSHPISDFVNVYFSESQEGYSVSHSKGLPISYILYPSYSEAYDDFSRVKALRVVNAFTHTDFNSLSLDSLQSIIDMTTVN